MSALGIGTTAEALASVDVPVLTFGKCNRGFQHLVEKVLGLPFLCLGLGLAAAGTLLTRLAEFVAGAPYVERRGSVERFEVNGRAHSKPTIRDSMLVNFLGPST